MRKTAQKSTQVAAKKSMKQAPKLVPQKSGKNTVFVVILMLIWVFCSVVASQLLIGYLMVWILGAERLSQPMWSGIYSLISYVLALVLIIYIPPMVNAKWHLSDGKKINNTKNTAEKTSEPIRLISREQIGLKGTPTWTDIGLAPIGFIVATLGAVLLVGLFSAFPWFDAEQAQETGFSIYLVGGERVIAFLALVVLAPIAEELIFRGWLYGKLRARLSAPLAILLTSALFGVMHFQWNVGVNVFVLSVVLCVLREITGTVYAGILTHMIKNGVAFYLLYVLGM